MLSKDFGLPDIQVHLHKLLPMGAGLGGGQATPPIPSKHLIKYATCGWMPSSNIYMPANWAVTAPSLLKTSRFTPLKKGDKFESLVLNLSGFWLTIIYPNIPVSTADAYRTCHPRGHESKIPCLKELIRLPVQEWKHHIFNDFETPVFRKHPEIQNIKEKDVPGRRAILQHERKRICSLRAV